MSSSELTMPHFDESTDRKELLRKAEEALARAERSEKRILVVLGGAICFAFLYTAWSCRDGCPTAAHWFYIVFLPAVIVFYLVRRHQDKRWLEENFGTPRSAVSDHEPDSDQANRQ